MHSRTMRIGLAIGSALAAVTAFALPASASPNPGSSPQSIRPQSIRPQSGADCNSNPLNAVYQCTAVVGAGLEINSITGSATNNMPYAINDVHIQIYGPQGSIYNCSTFSMGIYGKGPSCVWKNPNPSKQWPAGDYCSRTWQYDGDSYYEALATQCINVFAS